MTRQIFRHVARNWALTADTLRADDEVVEVAFLGLGSALVPVVLEEDGVDPEVAEGALPVEALEAGLQAVIDPELEHAVRPSDVVEARARLHAIPLAHVPLIENRRPAPRRAEPSKLAEVVVARRANHTGGIRARCRKDAQPVGLPV